MKGKALLYKAENWSATDNSTDIQRDSTFVEWGPRWIERSPPSCVQWTAPYRSHSLYNGSIEYSSLLWFMSLVGWLVNDMVNDTLEKILKETVVAWTKYCLLIVCRDLRKTNMFRVAGCPASSRTWLLMNTDQYRIASRHGDLRLIIDLTSICLVCLYSFWTI
jgi:hypothetical protein